MPVDLVTFLEEVIGSDEQLKRDILQVVTMLNFPAPFKVL